MSTSELPGRRHTTTGPEDPPALSADERRARALAVLQQPVRARATDRWRHVVAYAGLAAFVGVALYSLPALFVPPPPDPAQIERPAPGRPPELATTAGQNSAAATAAAVAAAAGANAALPILQAQPAGAAAPVTPGAPLAATAATAATETTYTVEIEMGATAADLAAELAAAGLIQDPSAFRERLADEGLDRLLQPGSYEIPVGADLDTVVDAFRP